MAKKLFVGIIFSCIFTTTGWATTPSPALIATPPQPMWSELTVPQKIVLAPLCDDWDSLEYHRQKKWLAIAANFSTMTPEEQRRIQRQMQRWGKLTPEQRQTARENFKTASQLPAEKKEALKKKWEEYSNLPEDEKERIKQQATNTLAPKPVHPATSAPAPVLLVPPSLPVTTPTGLSTSESATTAADVTNKP